MKFFNPLLLFYTLIVVILTLIYYYLCISVFTAPSSGIFVFAGYLVLVFASALLINMKDENSGYMGFNYHLVTYLIVTVLSFCIVLYFHDANTAANIRQILTVMLIWGVGIAFHFAMYLMFRSKKIGAYEKDDVFK
ncbi:MAG: 2TM domain-containing protein [Flavipsychrobacter sp.]